MESIEELKNICQSQKRSKNFLIMKGYLIHRDISIHVTRFILKFFPKVKPLSITILMLWVGTIGSLMVLSPNWIVTTAGIVVVYVSFILDKVDGEMARYKKKFSVQGMYLDEIYHLVVPTLLLTMFFFDYSDQVVVILTFLLGIFVVLNRCNRKIPSGLIVKINNLYNKEQLYFKKHEVVCNIFNSHVFKLFSFVDRFDFILLFLLITLFIEKFLWYGFDFLALIILVVSSVAYFTRWTVLIYAHELIKDSNS